MGVDDWDERPRATASRGLQSHGSEVHGHLINGIRLAEVRMPSGLRLASHAHPAGQLVLVQEGAYWERWSSQHVRLRPGSMLFRPPGQPHENGFDGGDVVALVVSYPRERLGSRAGRLPPTLLPSDLGDLVAQVRLELRRRDGSSRSALEGLALLLLSRVERLPDSGRAPGWLSEALNYVERHFAERIALDDVAGAVAVHRTTVAAAFRRHLNRSVGQAIRNARIRRALDLIVSGQKPLSEIALECGFFDQAHMGRLVRRHAGCSPAVIRRTAGLRRLRSPRSR